MLDDFALTCPERFMPEILLERLFDLFQTFPHTHVRLFLFPTLQQPWGPIYPAFTAMFHSIENHRRSPRDLRVQPGHIVRIHINAAMTPIIIILGGTRGISVWKVFPRPIAISPPAIVEEVAASVILHRILDSRRWIPECRPGRLARFELRWVLAQDNAPESGWGRQLVLSRDNVKRPDQFPIIVEAQRLFDQRDDEHLASLRSINIIVFHQANVGGVRLIHWRLIVIVSLHCPQV